MVALVDAMMKQISMGMELSSQGFSAYLGFVETLGFLSCQSAAKWYLFLSDAMWDCMFSVWLTVIRRDVYQWVVSHMLDISGWRV